MKKIRRIFLNHVSNLCSLLKSSRKGTNITFLELFINVMIRNLKIHSVLDIIKISKFMEPNKCTHENNVMKIYIKMFPMIFQS
jgi:hypothetical protein